MEEAYNQLYQEFLRLRSLCLKQAALLRQLTTGPQSQQGATDANGQLSTMAPLTVQCTPESSVYIKETPRPQAMLSPKLQCDIQCSYKNMGTFSELLAEDMFKLCMETPADRKGAKSGHSVSPLLSSVPTMSHGASHSIVKHPRHVDHPGEDAKCQRPLAGSQSHCCDLLMQSGEMLSDIVLQSHICQFCQAVFPANTGTGGEYLRHLHTHVT